MASDCFFFPFFLGFKIFARTQQVPAMTGERSYEKIVVTGRDLEGKERQMVHPESLESHGIQVMANNYDRGTRP